LTALRPSGVGALVAAGLHAAAFGTLLAYEPARSALLSAAPIMVDWIASPKPQPAVEPPKPRPMRQPTPQRIEPPPAIVAPADSPSPMVIAAPPPPEPVAAAEPPPAAVTAPVFDAAYLQNPAPAYPVLSRRLKEQGRVVLRVRVNAGGAADEVQVRSSSGFARLDESARETVTRWKFVAARRGREAVAEWVLIPISFKLEG